jgi:membrane fusion protein (multidrug efflux system)
MADPTPSQSQNVPAQSSPASGARQNRQARRRKRRWRLVALAGTVVLLVGGFGYYWFFLRPYETTDDAFIEADVIPIAPQVPGQVVKRLVADNQLVRAGDPLIEIDPRDYKARVAQAQASVAEARTRLDQARAQVISDQAKVEQEQANVVAAESETKRAEADLKRYQSIEAPAVSQSQIDLAVAQARSSEASLEVARSRNKAANVQVTLSQAGIQTAAAEVQRNEALLKQAQLELSYTKVSAPEDGFVSHRTVEAGAYVQAGQALLALVPARVYVLANFKETQLTHMLPGQPVRITVDAYPGRRFRAHVDSIQRGSGARFSVLPPENATGNYVKVVQRVPVKIVFDETPDQALALGPGMSVKPKVNVLETHKNGRASEIAGQGR